MANQFAFGQNVLISQINISAGTTSNLLSALTFSNSNGVSFGLNGSVITASAAGGGGGGSVNFSAGTTSGNLDSVVFSNSNGVSFGLNGSTITASAAGGGGSINLSAGTTSQNLTNFVLSNSNNVSFGLNGSTVTATATVATSLSNIRVSAGTTSNLLSAFTFNNGGGVSFGLDASTITATVATSLTNIRVSAGTTSNLLSAFTFNNGNGVSFGLDASTITASIATSLTNIRVSAGTTSNLLSALTFSNANGISFGIDASTITASHNGLTSQSNQAFSAAGGSSAFQTLEFSDINSVSFTNTGGAVGIASVKLQMFAVSNTTQSSSGTANHTALSFGGAGIASVGVTGGSVVISVPSGGGGGDGGVFAGVSNLGNTLGSTGTVSTGNFVLVGSNNITLSQSTGAAGSAATVTILGKSEITHSIWVPDTGGMEIISETMGNGSLRLMPLGPLPNIQFNNFYMGLSFSNASNSSGSGSLSVWVGLYGRNSDTLNIVASTSASVAVTMSGTVGSYSLFAGPRNFRIPWTETILANDYWLGLVSRTTTGGADMSFRNLVASNANVSMSGEFGSSSNSTRYSIIGLGQYSTTTGDIPSTIGLTQIVGTVSGARRQPLFWFGSL